MSRATEKRKHPRVAGKNVGAHVNFADRSTPCRIQNISAGGMLVESEEPLPAGIPVAVNLAQPGWSRALRLPGRVVWALAPKAAAKKGKSPGMRIRFDSLEPETAQLLLELLTSLGLSQTPAPEQIAADTLPPAPARKPSQAEMPARKPSQAAAPARKPSQVEMPKAAAPVGAPQTRTYRGAPQVDGRAVVAPPLGAPGTQTLPGHRTQELSLNDIVAHISKVDMPAVQLPKTQLVDDAVTGPTGRGDATLLNELPGPGSNVELARLTAQVRGLKLQLDELQRTLEERERELTEAREALGNKERALEKADRERKAAETAIQRLSMQLAARR